MTSTFDFNIGSYTYVTDPSRFYYKITLSDKLLDSIDIIKRYDHRLRQWLKKLFREHCLSSSVQIKEFLRGSQRDIDKKSIIESILKEEPMLSKYFSKVELGNLSLLWIAVLGCYQNSAELLVHFGADVNELFGCHYPQIIHMNSTILHVLLQMNFFPDNELLVSMAIDHGADLQAQDHEGQTILNYAVSNGRVQVAKMLLEKRVDVNAAGNNGMTPLLNAASNILTVELMPLLIEYGADIFAKSKSGENVLHRLGYVSDLQDSVDLARVLIKKGVSLDDKESREDYCPIHRAVHCNHNDLVKLYLDHGANVNALAKNGNSPLHVAAQFLMDTVTKTLLKGGANIHLKTSEGRTALHYACECAALINDHIRSKIVISLLITAGADVLIEDHDNKTPFALISSRRNGEQPGEESWPLIKALVLKKVLQPEIVLKDGTIIDRYPDLRKYYRRCNAEIKRMNSTTLNSTCTVFELLARSPHQIAALMRNPDFQANFQRYKLNKIPRKFPIYAGDVLRAFERAQDHYNSLLEQENVIDTAVYGIFPYMIVRKVAHYIAND